MASQSWSVYYANGKVLVPTRVETTVGVGMEIDPVDVIYVGNTAELNRAILTTIAKGNPIVPHPSQEEMSKPITFFKKLGFKSYKALNHEAITWDIRYKDDVYQIEFWQRDTKNGRGYVPDLSETITFPSNTPVESVVDKLIEIIQETHREKIAEATAK